MLLFRVCFFHLLIPFIFIGGVGFLHQSHAFTVPPLTGPVMDEAALLNIRTKDLLTQSLLQLQKEKNVQLQVYITQSLQDEAIESVAIQLFDQWKLGDEKTDQGLLFLIAPNEKKLRIEVGQGLEGDIPDVIAKRIIADVVKPYFQRGEFNAGVVQGVLSLQSYLGFQSETPFEAVLKQDSLETQASKKKPLNPVFILIVLGVWFVLFLMNPTFALYLLFALLRGGGGGRGGGGSWSGRGGRSSGGGASGGW